jgi:hypothetical protein
MYSYIIFVFLLILVLWVVYYHKDELLEGFVPDNSDIVAKHLQYIKDSQVKFNEITNTVNLTSPSIGIDPISASNVQQALNTVVAKPSAVTYTLEPPTTPLTTPDQLPGTIELAHKCEAAPKTCDAFNDPTFAANCGMSFDTSATNSSGSVVGVGGLYVSSYDRSQQTDAAMNVETTGAAPYDPYKVYQPTIGRSKAGTFGLTKDQCVVVKEKVDCAAKQTFGSPNCTQCYTSQKFSRVGPEAGRLPSILMMYGNGSISVSSSNPDIALPETDLGMNRAIQVTLPPYAEGETFTIAFKGNSNPAPFYLCGFIQGQTTSGTFRLDILSLVQKDTVTNARPRMTGTHTFDGFRCNTLMPGSGKATMNLACMMPFTFINNFDGNALGCENGPIITRAASATFLESDPCYGKANAPGNYKMECLQSRWTELGGTPSGTGYPRDTATANAIQRDANGNPIDIDTIVDRLSVKMSQAQTGNDANGNPLSIPDWNTVSMYATGTPITNPCDGPNNSLGPPSKACLSYLYANKGVDTRIGPTYTQAASQVASSKEGFSDLEGFENVPNTYNYPGTVIDPSTDAGLKFGQKLGSVAAAKQTYDEINRLANDNSKSNAERATALKQAYDITLGQPSSNDAKGPTQVFAVGKGYDYSKNEANDVCAKYGATVATTAQLQDAYAHGADWCFSGWVADGGGKWPITTSVVGGCGGRTGIIEWTPDNQKAGVTCYGPKPGINDPASKDGMIKPFNQQMWDQPTDPTYLTIPAGYLETTGPQPACFNGLSLDDAQKNCNALGSQCVGFSYSKDGSGNGCYKGNHNAGMNNNASYMGYVKIPVAAASSTISGRYIKFQYDRVECLNLAEIKVYRTKGGPNIITPNTIITKSSGYQGDIFPVQNFIDGNTSNFVHTSCGDVPWIQVDLGSTMELYKVVIYNRTDCCQSRILGATLHILNDEGADVYISAPVSSTNQTYAWFPPNPAIQVDLPEDIPPPPPPPPLKATLFYDCWFSAQAVELGPGNYDIDQMGIAPYNLSSLRVPSGLTVVLYDSPGFTGNSMTVTSDNSCLVYNDFNDRTASIRIY